MKTLRCILTGLGNIGRTFLDILPARAASLRDRYGIDLRIVAAADSSGVAVSPHGLDVVAVAALKRQRRGVVELPGVGRPGGDIAEVIRTVDAEFLLEATPTDIRTGQPGLDLVRTAFARGLNVVMASKGALVVAFDELASASDWNGDTSKPALRFSGAVASALPTVNLGWRDLAGAHISRIEAVLNSTTQVMLTMMRGGKSYAEALAEAQRIGVAEPDPTLDVDGWDAANKLVILANAVLRQPTKLSDLTVTGITGVTRERLEAASAAGGALILLAKAERRASGDGYDLSVAPTVVAGDHPLSRLGAQENGIVYHTDTVGRLAAFCLGEGPTGTAAAMLRDVIAIATR
jgi:homoserine dehydrogenase